MARLPSVDDLARPTPQVQRRIVGREPARSLEAGARGQIDILQSVSDLGGTISNVGRDWNEAVRAEQERLDTIAAESAFNKLRLAQQELILGEDGFHQYKGADANRDKMKDYLIRFEDQAQLIHDGLVNSNQRSLFLKRAEVSALEYREDLLTYVAGQTETMAKNTYDATLDVEISNTSAKWNAPSAIALSMTRIDNAILEESKRLGWTTEQLEDAMLDAHSRVHETVISQALANDEVEYANEWMKQNEKEIKPAVAARIQSANEARTRLRLAEEERQYRLLQREETEMNEAAAEEGDGLVRDGTLTAEWLEANAGRLSTADQRYYQRILSGEEAVSTDLEVYTDLRERAGRGEDVKSEARLALTERRIKQSDYDKILNAFESTTVRPWYKRGETYLTNFLKPSEINYNIDQAQAYALAMDDWQRWAESNPDATIEQAEAAYRRIGQNYQTIEIENTFFRREVPFYLVGSRIKPTLENIEETAERTAQALELGEINEEEFERQAEIIMNWREILLKRQSTETGEAP